MIGRYLSKLGALLNSNGQVQTAGIADAGITQAKLASNIVGNGPAFSAYATAAQTIGAGVQAKVVLNAEEFDTNNNFDSTTTYRFTPTVAGYYMFNGAFFSNLSGSRINLTLFKNNNEFKRLVDSNLASSVYQMSGSAVIYLNGSTDYVELFVYTSTGLTSLGGGSLTYLNGALIRAA